MLRSTLHHTAIALLAAALVGCGGGGDAPVAPPVVPPTPTASIALGAAASSLVAGATTPLTVTLTRGGGFAGAVTVSASGLPSGVTVASQTVDASATSATLSIVTTSAATPATTSISITGTGSGVSIAAQTFALTITAPAAPIAQIGTDILNSDGNFGSKMALSANGNRVVVSAYTSANGTTRVYERSGTTWTQLGADVIGEAADDRAGTSVDINAAGTRIAVGAYLNDGGGNGSGHVRVYNLVGSTWTQVGADLDGDAAAWGMGWSVALSGSGNRVIASAPTISGTTGHMKVFELVGGAWTQLGATITAGNEFGDAVDISSDGTTIAVSSTSANGSSRAGTVQVFRLSGATWTQIGNTLQGTGLGDLFGQGLSLSANGARIAVAAPVDRDGGVSGGGSTAGKVRVFDLIGTTWTQVGGDVLGAVGLNGENLGETLALSDDGTRFAATGAGQSVAKVYTLVSGAWVQTGANITANTGGARSEGLALSADGRTVAVGFVNGTPRRARVFSIAP